MSIVISKNSVKSELTFTKQELKKMNVSTKGLTAESLEEQVHNFIKTIPEKNTDKILVEEIDIEVQTMGEKEEIFEQVSKIRKELYLLRDLIALHEKDWEADFMRDMTDSAICSMNRIHEDSEDEVQD